MKVTLVGTKNRIGMKGVKDNTTPVNQEPSHNVVNLLKKHMKTIKSHQSK